MSGVEVLVALAIAVGLVGILVPILPGSVLVLAAILVWAWEVGGTTAWAVFGVAAAVLVAGGVVKYLVPNRRLKGAGIPGSTQWVGAALGIVGFFVDSRHRAVHRVRARRLPGGVPPPRREGGLAVDQALAQGGRAQHPHRARRRPWSRPSSGSPAWSSRDGAAVAAGRGGVRVVGLQRRLGVEAGQRLDGRPGLAVRRRRWPPWRSHSRPTHARPAPTWPGPCWPGSATGSAPRSSTAACPRAGWAWWRRSPASARRSCRW